MEESSKAKAYKKLCASNDKYAENYDKIDWGRPVKRTIYYDKIVIPGEPEYSGPLNLFDAVVRMSYPELLKKLDDEIREDLAKKFGVSPEMLNPEKENLCTQDAPANNASKPTTDLKTSSSALEMPAKKKFAPPAP